MLYALGADFLLITHLAFIVFVVLGGLVVLRWRWFLYLHLPAAAWGTLIELTGGICPLTTLEVTFRRAAGEAGYSGSFIEHYLLPIIYPAGLNQRTQLLLAATVVTVNLCIYGWFMLRPTSRRQ